MVASPPAILAALDSQILWLIPASLGLILLFHQVNRLRPRLQVRLVGPIFWYDLARLARRNRTALLRFVYGFFLLAWVYFALANYFPQYIHFSMWFQPGPRFSPQVMAGFALKMVAAVVAVQGAAVFVVTPAYLANAIAEERERGTLGLLFATPLLDREIILGKLLGRVAHMGLILLTGLPILAVVRVWGGVDGWLLLAGFAITGLTLLSVGSVSILCSVLAPNVLTAVVSSYAAVGFLFVFTLGCPAASPLTFVPAFSAAIETMNSAGTSAVPGVATAAPLDLLSLVIKVFIAPVVLHGGIFILCTALSISALRGFKPDPERQHLRVVQPAYDEYGSWGPYEEPEVYVGRAPRVMYPYRRPVCDPPLLWKEVYHGGLAPTGPLLPDWGTRDYVCLAILLVLLGAFFASMHRLFPRPMAEAVLGLNYFIRVFTIILCGVWCVALAFRAAISVCHERECKTLEGLFLLPVERTEILWAKWLGSVLRLRHIGYCLIVLWTAGLITGALHPWAVLLLAAACGVYLAFLATIGICLSLMNRNMLWSNLSMALVLLLLVTGSMTREASYRYTSALYARQGEWLGSLLDVGFNPVRTWWLSGFSWQQLVDRIRAEDMLLGPMIGSTLAGLTILASATWVLWRLACVRFGRELERKRG